MPADDQTERLGYRAAFASGEFRALFVAYVISLVGTVVSGVALTVLVYERTGSPFLAALTFSLGFLPHALSGLFLSALVDRVPPRLLLTACDAAGAVLVGLMALPQTPLPALMVLLFLTSSITAVSAGARSGLVRVVAGDAAFVPARSLLRIAAQSAQIAGNGLGGLLLIAFAPRSLIVGDAVSFAVSALITWRWLRPRPAAGSAGGRIVGDSLRGAGEIMRLPAVRRLLLFSWLVPPFAIAPEALAAPYLLDQGYDRSLVGWWLLAIPVGVVAGDLLGVWFMSERRQQRLVTPLAVVSVAPCIAFALHPPVAIGMALLVVAGLGAAYFLGLDGLIRDATPEPLFARTMAISTAGLMTVQGVAFALAGAFAQLVSPTTVIALGGAIGVVVVLSLGPRGSLN